jgi:hypothetical protein
MSCCLWWIYNPAWTSLTVDFLVKDGECPLLESARTYTRVTPCQVGTQGAESATGRSAKVKSILKGTPRDHPIQVSAFMLASALKKPETKLDGFNVVGDLLFYSFLLLVNSGLILKSLRMYVCKHPITPRYQKYWPIDKLCVLEWTLFVQSISVL